MTTPYLTPLPSPNLERAGVSGMRIGDAERDQTCAVLASHFAAGRLGPDELDQRTSLAVSATTGGELLRLTADLPPLGSPQPRPARPLPRPVPDQGRAAVMVLWGLVSGAAALCTMLLLFGATGMHDGAWVWLSAFGAAVASSGITYFVTRRR